MTMRHMKWACAYLGLSLSLTCDGSLGFSLTLVP
ncbi:hypothetical protein SLEP1_g15748 [Rubroshorea leprosula]|uniref:Uncharacterized protein n=1 Tax=Rubroshorea leprosula TaxID=152421 RepID=A0AAV5INI8_9ROSI|nr:hypothetical protein SLEP1_g15748 [Rubroshorea leprosula]